MPESAGRLRLGIALLVVLAAAASGASQGAPNAADVADLIAAELKAASVPGAAIAVVSGDQMLARGYGIANVETNAPLPGRTLRARTERAGRCGDLS